MSVTCVISGSAGILPTKKHQLATSIPACGIQTCQQKGHPQVSQPSEQLSASFSYSIQQEDRIDSPTLGCFLQPDPIGFDAGDVNWYRYVGNNAVNYTDPDGLIPPALIIGGLAAAGHIYCEIVIHAFQADCERKTETARAMCDLKGDCYEFKPNNAERKCAASSYSGPCGGECVKKSK
jgi:RHS repeat-associated protein